MSSQLPLQYYEISSGTNVVELNIINTNNNIMYVDICYTNNVYYVNNNTYPYILTLIRQGLSSYSTIIINSYYSKILLPNSNISISGLMFLKINWQNPYNVLIGLTSQTNDIIYKNNLSHISNTLFFNNTITATISNRTVDLYIGSVILPQLQQSIYSNCKYIKFSFDNSSNILKTINQNYLNVYHPCSKPYRFNTYVLCQIDRSTNFTIKYAELYDNEYNYIDSIILTIYHQASVLFNTKSAILCSQWYHSSLYYIISSPASNNFYPRHTNYVPHLFYIKFTYSTQNYIEDESKAVLVNPYNVFLYSLTTPQNFNNPNNNNKCHLYIVAYIYNRYTDELIGNYKYLCILDNISEVNIFPIQLSNEKNQIYYNNELDIYYYIDYVKMIFYNGINDYEFFKDNIATYTAITGNDVTLTLGEPNVPITIPNYIISSDQYIIKIRCKHIASYNVEYIYKFIRINNYELPTIEFTDSAYYNTITGIIYNNDKESRYYLPMPLNIKIINKCPLMSITMFCNINNQYRQYIYNNTKNITIDEKTINQNNVFNVSENKFIVPAYFNLSAKVIDATNLAPLTANSYFYFVYSFKPPELIYNQQNNNLIIKSADLSATMACVLEYWFDDDINNKIIINKDEYNSKNKIIIVPINKTVTVYARLAKANNYFNTVFPSKIVSLLCEVNKAKTINLIFTPPSNSIFYGPKHITISANSEDIENLQDVKIYYSINDNNNITTLYTQSIFIINNCTIYALAKYGNFISNYFTASYTINKKLIGNLMIHPSNITFNDSLTITVNYTPHADQQTIETEIRYALIDINNDINEISKNTLPNIVNNNQIIITDSCKLIITVFSKNDEYERLDTIIRNTYYKNIQPIPDSPKIQFSLLKNILIVSSDDNNKNIVYSINNNEWISVSSYIIPIVVNNNDVIKAYVQGYSDIIYEYIAQFPSLPSPLINNKNNNEIINFNNNVVLSITVSTNIPSNNYNIYYTICDINTDNNSINPNINWDTQSNIKINNNCKVAAKLIGDGYKESNTTIVVFQKNQLSEDIEELELKVVYPDNYIPNNNIKTNKVTVQVQYTKNKQLLYIICKDNQILQQNTIISKSTIDITTPNVVLNVIAPDTNEVASLFLPFEFTTDYDIKLGNLYYNLPITITIDNITIDGNEDQECKLLVSNINMSASAPIMIPNNIWYKMFATYIERKDNNIHGQVIHTRVMGEGYAPWVEQLNPITNNIEKYPYIGYASILSKEVIVDLLPPTIEKFDIVKYNNNLKYNYGVKAKYLIQNVNDIDSGILAFRILEETNNKLNYTDWILWGTIASDSKTIEDYVNLIDNILFNDIGQRKVWCQIIDKVGNITESNIVYLYNQLRTVIDYTPPKGNIQLLNPTYKAPQLIDSSTQYLLNLNAYDDISGIKDFRYIVFNDDNTQSYQWSNWLPYNNKININIPNFEGISKINVQFRDYANNISENNCNWVTLKNNYFDEELYTAACKLNNVLYIAATKTKYYNNLKLKFDSTYKKAYILNEDNVLPINNDYRIKITNNNLNQEYRRAYCCEFVYEQGKYKCITNSYIKYKTFYFVSTGKLPTYNNGNNLEGKEVTTIDEINFMIDNTIIEFDNEGEGLHYIVLSDFYNPYYINENDNTINFVNQQIPESLNVEIKKDYVVFYIYKNNIIEKTNISIDNERLITKMINVIYNNKEYILFGTEKGNLYSFNGISIDKLYSFGYYPNAKVVTLPIVELYEYKFINEKTSYVYLTTYNISYIYRNTIDNVFNGTSWENINNNPQKYCYCNNIIGYFNTIYCSMTNKSIKEITNNIINKVILLNYNVASFKIAGDILFAATTENVILSYKNEFIINNTIEQNYNIIDLTNYQNQIPNLWQYYDNGYTTLIEWGKSNEYNIKIDNLNNLLMIIGNSNHITNLTLNKNNLWEQALTQTINNKWTIELMVTSYQKQENNNITYQYQGIKIQDGRYVLDVFYSPNYISIKSGNKIINPVLYSYSKPFKYYSDKKSHEVNKGVEFILDETNILNKGIRIDYNENNYTYLIKWENVFTPFILNEYIKIIVIAKVIEEVNLLNKKIGLVCGYSNLYDLYNIPWTEKLIVSENQDYNEYEFIVPYNGLVNTIAIASNVELNIKCIEIINTNKCANSNDSIIPIRICVDDRDVKVWVGYVEHPIIEETNFLCEQTGKKTLTIGKNTLYLKDINPLILLLNPISITGFASNNNSYIWFNGTNNITKLNSIRFENNASNYIDVNLIYDVAFIGYVKNINKNQQTFMDYVKLTEQEFEILNNPNEADYTIIKIKQLKDNDMNVIKLNLPNENKVYSFTLLYGEYVDNNTLIDQSIWGYQNIKFKIGVNEPPVTRKNNTFNLQAMLPSIRQINSLINYNGTVWVFTNGNYENISYNSTEENLIKIFYYEPNKQVWVREFNSQFDKNPINEILFIEPFQNTLIIGGQHLKSTNDYIIVPDNTITAINKTIGIDEVVLDYIHVNSVSGIKIIGKYLIYDNTNEIKISFYNGYIWNTVKIFNNNIPSIWIENKNIAISGNYIYDNWNFVELQLAQQQNQLYVYLPDGIYTYANNVISESDKKVIIPPFVTLKGNSPITCKIQANVFVAKHGNIFDVDIQNSETTEHNIYFEQYNPTPFDDII